MTPETDRNALRARDTEFLRDLARRLFAWATPAMGFDQGDVDQLYRIALRLDEAEQRAREAEEIAGQALEECRTRFIEYAYSHSRKGTADGDMVDLCSAALDRLRARIGTADEGGGDTAYALEWRPLPPATDARREDR